MRRPRKPINQINVVPYIDVMLVLLVIFMVTAPLVNPGEIELPRVGMQLTSPTQPLEVTVAPDGRLTLRDRQTGQSVPNVSQAELVSRVKAKVQLNPGQAVVIAGDGGTRYENVLNVLDVLKRSGVDRVGLLAQPAAK